MKEETRSLNPPTVVDRRSCDFFAYQRRHFAGKFGNFAHTLGERGSVALKKLHLRTCSHPERNRRALWSKLYTLTGILIISDCLGTAVAYIDVMQNGFRRFTSCFRH